MTRFLFWIFVLPVAAAVVAFAVTNRDAVTVDLWPAPYAATVPVWAIALVGGLVGFLFGGVVMWRAGSKSRDLGRVERRRADALERDVMMEKEKQAKAERMQAHPAQVDALPAPK